MINLLIFSPILLVLNCLFLFLFSKWIGPMGTYYASVGTMLLTLVLLSQILLQLLKNGGYWFIDFGRWFFCLNWFDSHLVFCFDILGTVTAMLVVSLTILALTFGVEYMYREAFINRLLYLLNLFATSVFMLFFCYDLFLIMVAWECIGLFSLLLVNFYSTSMYTIKAALKTFMLSRLSDLSLFLFFVLTLLFFHSTDLSLIFIQIPFLSFHYIFFGNWAWHFLSIYALSLTLSGVMKSAQFLAHVWLPDAMEAPTPASALIHSSTLVVAGMFLILRFSILFEFTPIMNYFLAALGAVTLSFASVVAMFQNDIKKLVAFSTISQIGYLVCGCGFLCYEEVLIYLIVHALNKAFLFMMVGYTVHFFAGNTDLSQMGSSFLVSFDLAVLMFGVSLNLCGLPYSAGFMGKEFLIFQFFGSDWFGLFISASWMISFFCTPMYMGLLIFIVLYGAKRGSWTSYTDIKTPFSGGRVGGLEGMNLVSNQSSPVTGFMSTSLLTFFWFGFFWGGEMILLLTLNYMSLGDMIVSPSFTFLHEYVPFEMGGNNSNFLNKFNWGLFMFIFASFNFLFNLKHASLYYMFTSVMFTEWIVLSFVLLTFGLTYLNLIICGTMLLVMLNNMSSGL